MFKCYNSDKISHFLSLFIDFCSKITLHNIYDMEISKIITIKDDIIMKSNKFTRLHIQENSCIEIKYLI